MAEKYTAWLGIVAFEFNPDKDQRVVSGKTVRKYTLNVDGYEDTVQIDLWPDFDDVKLKRGDLVTVGGKAKTWDREQVLENGDTRIKSTWQMQPYTIQVEDKVYKSTPPGVKQSGEGTPVVKRKTF